jgi:hypothetical protein
VSCLCYGILLQERPYILPNNRFVTALTLEASYGHQIKGKDDHFVRLAKSALSDFGRGTEAAAFVVDSFPWRTLKKQALGFDR